MTRRLAPVVTDPDAERRARLAPWRGRNGGPQHHPDVPVVGDPEWADTPPRERVTDPVDSRFRAGTGAWRRAPGMADHLAFLAREWDREHA